MDTWAGNNHDPITLHKYLYANANPANGIDPSGHMTLASVNIASGGLSNISMSNVIRYTNLFNKVMNKLDTTLTFIEMGRSLSKIFSNNQFIRNVKNVRNLPNEQRFMNQIRNPEEGLNTLMSNLPRIVSEISSKGLIKDLFSNKKNNLLLYGPTPEFAKTPWPKVGSRVMIGKIRIKNKSRKVLLEIGASKKHRGRFLGIGNTQGSTDGHKQWFRMDYHKPHGNEDAIWGNYHAHYGGK